jgi:uncharacterized damage-inducible protein DinB
MATDLSQLFQHQARYNARANREMFAVLSQLTGRGRRRDAGSWFGSIHGILNHLIITDINWLRRFRALSPNSTVLSDPGLDPPNLSWNHDLYDDFAGLSVGRVSVDGLIIAWFEEFPPARCGEIFDYQDSAGSLRSAQAAEAFAFLFTHQTHHRGQISQILDALGLPNNMADNIAYLERPGK